MTTSNWPRPLEIAEPDDVETAAAHVLLALTAALAAELADTPIILNAVDPDLTATWPGAEATRARPAAASAEGVVWAATLPDHGPRDGFYRDGHRLPW